MSSSEVKLAFTIFIFRLAHNGGNVDTIETHTTTKLIDYSFAENVFHMINGLFGYCHYIFTRKYRPLYYNKKTKIALYLYKLLLA